MLLFQKSSQLFQLNIPILLFQSSSQLFQRAILMSGSSLATSAVVKDPRDVTRQVQGHTTWSVYTSDWTHNMETIYL